MKTLLTICLMLSFSASALEVDWSIDKNNCSAYSKTTMLNNGGFYILASITESGSLRATIVFSSTNDLTPLDGAQVFPTNGKNITYVVTTPTPKTIMFEPQQPTDTIYLLTTATTGSVNFNNVILRTAGTNKVIEHLFSNCN
ncbi:MAG: hypothetical protein ACRC6D_09930 [Aeromonas sp.]